MDETFISKQSGSVLPSLPSPWAPGILLVLAVSIWWLHWWSNAQKDLCLITSNNVSCGNPSLACFYCGPDLSPASGKKDCFPSQLQAEHLHPILPNTTFFPSFYSLHTLVSFLYLSANKPVDELIHLD